MFIGREVELGLLNDFYNDNNKKVLCLTGQVGMGKTTLLRHFAEDKKHIFHIAYPTTDVGQMVLFARSINEAFDIPKYEATANLSQLNKVYSKELNLTELMELIAEKAGDDKLLLIIDQYNDFVKADPSYEKILHEYISEKWAGNNIKLIICGDSFLAMDKYVYGKKAIWKDTDITSIKLGAMGFYDSCKFFPEKSGEERALLYGLTGGIPAHLSEATGDITYAVAAIYGNSITPLPEDTMSIDLRELSYYNRILMTLAQGNLRVNQISQIVGKRKDVVVPYMNTLMDIDVVTKDTAITERNNRKKTRYGIVNTNFLFWYRYIAPNIDMYYRGEINDLWEKLIKSEIDDYMKMVFVRMCKEYIQKEADALRMPFSVDDIGNWWENDEEKGTTAGFDLVALGENEDKPCMVFARCYYNDEPIEMATLKDLIEMTKHVGAKGDVFYIVFSKSGFHENTLTVAGAIKNIMLITLDDVSKL